MDFDEEMSSLQIEDLGEYFFPNEMSNDNWKGFSLGYMEEEKEKAPPLSSQSQSQPLGQSTETSSSSSSSMPIAIAQSGNGNGNGLLDPSLLTSPPLLSASFSEMLKHTNAFNEHSNGPAPSSSSTTLADALNFGSIDFPMSPALMNAAATSLQLSMQTSQTAASTLQTQSHSSSFQSHTQVNPSIGKPISKDDELMALANFTLDGHPSMRLPSRPTHPRTATELATAQPSHIPIKPMLRKAPSPTGKGIMEEDDEDDDDDDDDRVNAKKPGFAAFGKRPFDMVDSGQRGACSTIGGAPEDDRGFRKKSREKMRRQEVNVKFEELIDLLGLSNRVRKSAILQEAVTAIKTLRREREEMRRDRDRLQQEVSKLATCLQYSHFGSVAAANAVAMNQAPGLSSFHPQQANQHHHVSQNVSTGQSTPTVSSTAHLNMPCASGNGCYPIGATFGSSLNAPALQKRVVLAPSPTMATPIAPKLAKSSPK